MAHFTGQIANLTYPCHVPRFDHRVQSLERFVQYKNNIILKKYYFKK